MFQNTCNFYELRSEMFQDFFIPVEESIVYEPEVFCPSEDYCSDCDTKIYQTRSSFYGYRDMPAPRTSFTTEEAKKIGTIIGIDWPRSPFDIEEFRAGLDVELEHGRRDPQTNVTGDDPIMTGKIALAHLKEFPDYYVRLAKLEDEAKAYWKNRDKSN
jgi:hypothetical protein